MTDVNAKPCEHAWRAKTISEIVAVTEEGVERRVTCGECGAVWLETSDTKMAQIALAAARQEVAKLTISKAIHQEDASVIDPILCYVDDNCAYFTTQPLDKQWGDDWNDAPYEHNAGSPYAWTEGYSKEEPYQIIRLYFEGSYQTPADIAWGGNSSWSVEEINRGGIAWLIPGSEVKEPKPIFAGTALSEFKRLVQESGGKIYEHERETHE